jgi:septal ring-binding cell division protein DamX
MKWFREAASNGDPVSIGIVAEAEAGSEVPFVTEAELLATADEPEVVKNQADAPETEQISEMPPTVSADESIAGKAGSHGSAESIAGKAGSHGSAESIAGKAGSHGSAAGETWIAERDPAHYTIQVIALSQPEQLHDFIAGQSGLEPFAIYRQTKYKKPLWVLVQGDYPDLNSARLALQTFPETMQTREKLWIRRFEMVQRLLE